MSHYIKFLIKFFILLILGVLLLGVGFFAGQKAEINDPGLRFDISRLFQDKEIDISLIENVWDLIHEEYVGSEELDNELLILGAARGMVNSLNDPYSVFLDNEETTNFLESMTGKFEGVGIEITLREGNLLIVTPLKGTPAHRAGALAGDIITKIDEATTSGITIEEAVTKIRGPKGTTVVLTVRRRNSEEEIDLKIVRDTIEVPSVELEILDGGIAYIELNSFNENTDSEFSAVAQSILNSQADRIILDLRNNPGGFLDVAVRVAGWFVPPGSLIVTERLGDGSTREHRTQGSGSLRDIPLVVVVNEGSASASEIVAGALRDHKNVAIVGATTFGKGSVQTFKDLAGGTSLKITVAQWLTPSGAHITDQGIEPSVIIETNIEELADDIDRQLDKAVEIVLSL